MLRDSDGLFPVARLTYDGDVVLGLEDQAEPSSYEGLVVGENDPDGHVTVPLNGNVA